MDPQAPNCQGALCIEPVQTCGRYMGLLGGHKFRIVVCFSSPSLLSALTGSVALVCSFEQQSLYRKNWKRGSVGLLCTKCDDYLYRMFHILSSAVGRACLLLGLPVCCHTHYKCSLYLTLLLLRRQFGMLLYGIPGPYPRCPSVGCAEDFFRAGS